MKDYVFKTFETLKCKYVYDRSLDTIIRVSDDDYLEFSLLEQGIKNFNDSKVFLKFQKQGFFLKNNVERIEHPDLKYIKYYTSRRIEHMTLQVTQSCNLRCEYCIYSGAYKDQRTHSSKRMTWKVAKKAIDFYLERSIDSKHLSIGFYGGEPLLEFDLIKQCVRYLDEKVQGKRIEYYITTNGTLLNENIFSFLSSYSFHILISLDGNREEHNRHRRFISGEGSFDTIIDNIRKIKDKYPEESKTISFNAVMTPQSDLVCMMDYFQIEDVLRDNYVMFSDVAESLGSTPDDDERFWRVRLFEYLKYYMSLIGKIDGSSVSVLARHSLNNVLMAYQQMRKRTVLTPCFHHNGPCIPGSTRIFVTVTGDLYPCQNVSELSDFFRIGNIETGFNYDRVTRILNNGALTSQECMDCWKLRLCNICLQQVKHAGFDITKKDKQKECEHQEMRLLEYLQIISVLSEFGFDVEGIMQYE